MPLPDPLITVSLDRLSGTPVFAGTRVPVQILFDHLEGGQPLEEFLVDFPNCLPRACDCGLGTSESGACGRQPLYAAFPLMRFSERSFADIRIQMPLTVEAKDHEMGLPNPLIVSDSERQGGTPVFAGTRVPVQTLFDHLEAGDPLNVFLDDFPDVSREHAIAVLELAQRAAVAQAAAE